MVSYKGFFSYAKFNFFRDGTSLCGVFIAVHNVIQQLHIDSYVDVLTVVRQLRIDQPDVCNNIVCIQLHGSLYILIFLIVKKKELKYK